ncbi:metallophosphoesterase [Lichenihabitans sp. Uapishka_5]|uniref:metallophosphoesterase family protein n=1 Tax=Lichenihabitans sp. Uapishka_5 TaxID=3037302 RepID=UPI0029E7EA16|nr:metallophosphoesterase [Lichenihabitans sp. Uapishka_5]MDX7952373.1 metallophosphoesterase [Lichenihabitans sp. Uapishka_5]
MTPGPDPLAEPDAILAFAHIGDLHLTDAKARNFADLLLIVAQIEVECAPSLDFVVLPGDNADNGLPAQYALAATALKMLSVPVHAIPGDHDMEQGSLAAFHDTMRADPLPKALTVRGVRCLFLDISGPGSGGPDFRLGQDQLGWIESELNQAAQRGETTAIFTHTYPDDLKGDNETEALVALIATHDVALVDMGHTHYNELANDGRTIFAATRSTGQIEEGPVGYSIATLDAGVVGWRFKPLEDAFPFVVITTPADHRLLRGDDQHLGPTVEVRAFVFGRTPVASVACQGGQEGAWVTMTRRPDHRVWSGTLTLSAEDLAERRVPITVRATDASGRPGQHTILAATPAHVRPERIRNGSDAASIGAWPDNGIPGTQLGPNRNGKPSS